MKCVNSKLREAQNQLTLFIDNPAQSMQFSEAGGAGFMVEMIVTHIFFPSYLSLIYDNN